MRFILAAVVGFAALVSHAPGAAAADAQGRFVPKGYGSLPCTQFIKLLQDKKEAEISQVADWLNGFVSAYNVLTAQTYDVSPWHTDSVVIELVARACDQNPKEALVNAAHGIVRLMGETKLAAAEQLIEVKSGDRTVRIYPTVLKQAQATLVKLGLLAGTPDGSYGPKTKTAIEAFQDRVKLQKTSVPDVDTIFALFLTGRSQAPAAGG